MIDIAYKIIQPNKLIIEYPKVVKMFIGTVWMLISQEEKLLRVAASTERVARQFSARDVSPLIPQSPSNRAESRSNKSNWSWGSFTKRSRTC